MSAADVRWVRMTEGVMRDFKIDPSITYPDHHQLPAVAELLHENPDAVAVVLTSQMVVDVLDALSMMRDSERPDLAAITQEAIDAIDKQVMAVYRPDEQIGEATDGE